MNEILRQIMLSKGITREHLAERAGVDPKTVDRWISPGRVPQPRHRGIVASVLGHPPEEIWPVRRRDVLWFRPWREVEATATALRSFQLSVVPGLLQTEAYARAILTQAGVGPRDQIDGKVASRIMRQRILARANPPDFTAIVDEGALRRRVGDEKTMREQLAHLADMADTPHTRVHVVPASAGAYAGINGAFVLAGGPGQETVGYLDTQLSGHLTRSDDDIADLLAAWDSCRAEALPYRQSAQLIREWSQTWTWT